MSLHRYLYQSLDMVALKHTHRDVWLNKERMRKQVSATRLEHAHYFFAHCIFRSDLYEVQNLI